MKILIVEDEWPIAEDIRCLVKKILENESPSVHIEHTLENALIFLNEKPIDVLLLDLNLNSQDGFALLREIVSKSFHTIVISANINRAIEAFEYGVLDFIPKPYTEERLKTAFQRLSANNAIVGRAVKYISVKIGNGIRVVPLEEIRYFRSDNIYSELHLKEGATLICDKSLKQLIPLLPQGYLRIHKSFIVNAGTIERIKNLGGGQYRACTKFGDELPVSREKIDELRNFLNI
jgi:DNA-binding LytR/AlgR family response regulator